MPGCDGEVRRERAVQDSLGWPIGIPSVGDRTARLKSLTKLVVDFWFNLLDAGSIPAISTNLHAFRNPPPWFPPAVLRRFVIWPGIPDRRPGHAFVPTI